MPGTLTRKRSLLIKRQAALGVLETLTAAEGIGDIAEIGMPKPDLKPISSDNLAQQTFGHTKARFDEGAAVLPIAFSVPVYRPASPGALPGNGVSEILTGLFGLSETINAAVSVVYGPQTPNDLIQAPRASLEIVSGSESWPMVDARGTGTLVGASGADLLLTVDGKSPYTTPTGSATPASVAVPAGDPMRFAGAMVFAKDGGNIDIGGFTFDFGGEVSEEPWSGGTRVLIKNCKPMLTIPTNAVIGESKWAAILAATEFTLTGTWTGLVFTCTARRSDMTPEDQNGTYGNSEVFEVLTYSLTFS